MLMKSCSIFPWRHVGAARHGKLFLDADLRLREAGTVECSIAVCVEGE